MALDSTGLVTKSALFAVAATKESQMSLELDSMFEWKELFKKLKTPEKIVKAIVNSNPSFVLTLKNYLETHLTSFSKKMQSNIQNLALYYDGFEVNLELDSTTVSPTPTPKNVLSTATSLPEGMYAYAKSLELQDDLEASSRWYLKAAQNGHLLAQHKMVWLFYSGTCGIKQDHKRSNEWLYKAATQLKKLRLCLLFVVTR